MSLPVVAVVSGTETPIGEGKTKPIRCLVRFEDKSIKAAVVKHLSPQGVAAEAFAALLLRGWGLNVPEPAIVTQPVLAFASLDTGYPNLKQRLGWSESFPPQVKAVLETSGVRLVAGFLDTPRALAADEAIDNRDRNLGNILWDGSNAAWIDHERALGVVADADVNKLVLMVLAAGDHKGVEAAAVAIALSLGPQVVADADADCALLDVSGFAQKVTSRLGPLATKVLQRFPQPNDLFAPLADAPGGTK